ncbi:MAG: 4-hydroxy-tetrahydrodipicolinate reductase [Eubacteriales bacterium]|nr:4-hydroxy-tetrahydrodipicolinate reductase [Eubacteriales bacterium]
MKVMITGYGRMGKLIEKTLTSAGDQVVARIDLDNSTMLETLEKVADVIMDFSNPSFTDQVIAYSSRTATPLLSGTTNMTALQHKALADLAECGGPEGHGVPVLWASNYSLGINLFMHLLPQVATALEDWDIEITETHHNKKVDAPSGTAKSLADAIDPEGNYKRVDGRSGNCGVRSKKEIGIHALRGGTVTGEHKVDFFGNDEVFEITHKAGSRQILVDGAIGAARKLILKRPGLYDMESLLFGA